MTQYHKIVGVEKEEVRLFVDWLEQGVFHALQHKYLEVVLLEVFASDKPKGSNKKKTGKKQLLECFSFKVSYDKNGAQFHVSGSGGTSRPLDSKEHIKRNTSEVLRSLVALTHSLRPLPPNRILSMKVCLQNLSCILTHFIC